MNNFKVINMWYAQYLVKGGSGKQKKYAQNKERGIPAKEILPGYSRVTPDIMRLLSKPVGEFTKQEYSNFKDAYDNAIAEWKIKKEEEEFNRRERAKVTTPLTYEQKNFIMSNENTIREMAKRALIEQIYQGKINPNFGLDEDFRVDKELLEDFAQEALIKIMEIIPRKWGEVENKHRAKYIHTTLRSMAETFMRSVYPSITQDYWQNRQYLPVPAAQYSYKMKKRQKLIKFLDDKIIEEFGQQVFFRATPQDMEEIIDYLSDKYRGDLFAIMEDLGINPGYFRKELSRYKEMRVANAGGRTQVENIEPEEITEEEIERAEFMAENPQYLFQEMQDKDTSKIIIDFLNKSPEPVRLMVSLIYGIDFNKLGLNTDEIGSKFGMPFENFIDKMYKNTNNEIKWSKFKKMILNTYGEIYGFLKRGYSLSDFNEALLERFKEYIEEGKYTGKIDERYYPINLQASRNFYSKKYAQIKLAQNNDNGYDEEQLEKAKKMKEMVEFSRNNQGVPFKNSKGEVFKILNLVSYDLNKNEFYFSCVFYKDGNYKSRDRDNFYWRTVSYEEIKNSEVIHPSESPRFDRLFFRHDADYFRGANFLDNRNNEIYIMKGYNDYYEKGLGFILENKNTGKEIIVGEDEFNDNFYFMDIQDSFADLDYDQITDNIFVGESPRGGGGEMEILKQLGIDVVLAFDSRAVNEAEELEKYGIDYKAIFFPDHELPTEQQLSEAVSYIDSVVSNGRKIYIHCLEGIGRSPFVLLFYFLNKGMDPLNALSMVGKRIPDMSHEQAYYIKYFLENKNYNNIREFFDILHDLSMKRIFIDREKKGKRRGWWEMRD